MNKQWSAKWITPETDRADVTDRPGAGYLKKAFHFAAGPDRKEILTQGASSDQRTGEAQTDGFNPEKHYPARLYITAHGLYEAYLDGGRIGQDVLTPGCDEYDKRLQYQVYDLELTEGDHELMVILGDGWYRGCSGIDGVRNLFGSDLSLLAEIVLGDELIVKTDASWEGSMDGPILLTDLELGETYDARKETVQSFHPVRELTEAPKPEKGLKQTGFGYENLVPTKTLPIREREVFEGRLFETPSGEKVFDFGQNLAGYTRLIIEDAKAGDTIRLIHGETLDENGNFTIANFQPGDRNKSGGIKQETGYTCKAGAQSYQPRFSMFGFRYAKIETALPLDQIRVEAIAVYSDMKQTAFFSCGVPEVEQLFFNSIWSMKGNFCDIPTDCPTRERAGWTGDAGVFSPTGVRLMNSAPVFEKWLANVRELQHDDGKMAYIAPSNGKPGMIGEMFSASVGWGDASVLVPWAIYEVYGEKKILEDNYDMMKRWVDFLEARASKTRPENLLKGDAWRKYVIDTGMDYGEWCEPGANVMETMKKASLHGQPEVATAYFAHSSHLLGQIAQILGNEADAKHYFDLSYQVRRAYRQTFLKDGHIESERQCEYVRPIAFGLLNAQEEKTAAEDLNRMVIENGYHLNTGFLSTPYLTKVLADHGYVDTAYRLLLQDECPGWLYAVKKGASTIWETWDGIREDGTVHDSLNHYSYGAISLWLMEGVCGIRYTHDQLQIRPQPYPALKRAKMVYDSPKGWIVSSWEYVQVGSQEEVQDGSHEYAQDGSDEDASNLTVDKKASNVLRYHIEIPAGLTALFAMPGEKEKVLTEGVYDGEILV
ncbi:MAG: family 78 glycoside hydrolase catalytic domain [Firmicutes bacterium]|nr:family 78 glycoside hydrolase catalytic domain [Bacillota bacterium]